MEPLFDHRAAFSVQCVTLRVASLWVEAQIWIWTFKQVVGIEYDVAVAATTYFDDGTS